MLYHSLSSYPDKIDELIFFQDISIEQSSTMETYNNYIANQAYSDANSYIDKQYGIHGYFAGLFNLIENRIDTLQCVLLEKVKINPIQSSETEPEELSEDTIWIEES